MEKFKSKIRKTNSSTKKVINCSFVEIGFAKLSRDSFYDLGSEICLIGNICVVERQIAAIRAIFDVEVEQTRTALRLLCSYFTEEQLDTPVLEFFKENLPDLSMTQNEETREIEIKWKNEIDGESSMGNVDGVEMTCSIIKRLSMNFPGLYTRQSLCGYDLPDNGRNNKS